MQEVQALDLKTIPLPYITGAVATLRQLRDDMIKAQGACIAPPIDSSVVPGPYANVLGLQKNHKRQVQGPPQPKSKRALRVQTKRKLAELPTYQKRQ